MSAPPSAVSTQKTMGQLSEMTLALGPHTKRQIMGT